MVAWRLLRVLKGWFGVALHLEVMVRAELPGRDDLVHGRGDLGQLGVPGDFDDADFFGLANEEAQAPAA